jgi:hypothetical protein
MNKIRSAASAGSGGPPRALWRAAARARRQFHGGAPGGGRALTQDRRCEVRNQGAEALGQVDIMLVMSSEEREGFWQAGCAPSLRAA